MKRFVLAFALIFTFSAAMVAQNGNNNNLKAKAKKEAKAAGCLDGYNGPTEVQLNTVSACFAGGFVIEALVVPVCNGPGCENVRLAPLARVMFNCTEEASSVECLR